MSVLKNLYYRSAMLIAAMLSAVLYVCANSTSCLMVYQPEAPETLNHYSKIK